MYALLAVSFTDCIWNYQLYNLYFKNYVINKIMFLTNYYMIYCSKIFTV